MWNSKAFLEKPLLAKADGPIGAYRKCAWQFYTAEARGGLARAGISRLFGKPDFCRIASTGRVDRVFPPGLWLGCRAASTSL